MKQTILIVEDEESIVDILTYSLRKEGYTVHTALTGKQAIEKFQGLEINLVILDLMLPDATGFDLCKQLTAMSSVPILMLTARNDIVDKVLGLELGAEDYMTKPFDIRELLARIKVLLRRNHQAASKKLFITNGIFIDPISHEVFKHNEPVHLKPKEYELLLLFTQNKNRVFSRDEILDTVWDMDFEGGYRTVDVHVQRIRKKLEPAIIETVFGTGYRMRGSL
ncbi:response regulator transcription factor [Bacillus sp. FJAT-27251]|uniref:response regulator transcription factor n=1 Tax=Bacillus sp. FJAT-27251 TaxID=1684142 RepID=UPI0006A79217|nr:response regulator transcription factor [Bacillus sp. FJAT-27251]